LLVIENKVNEFIYQYFSNLNGSVLTFRDLEASLCSYLRSTHTKPYFKVGDPNELEIDTENQSIEHRSHTDFNYFGIGELKLHPMISKIFPICRSDIIMLNYSDVLVCFYEYLEKNIISKYNEFSIELFIQYLESKFNVGNICELGIYFIGNFQKEFLVFNHLLNKLTKDRISFQNQILSSYNYNNDDAKDNSTQNSSTSKNSKFVPVEFKFSQRNLTQTFINKLTYMVENCSELDGHHPSFTKLYKLIGDNLCMNQQQQQHLTHQNQVNNSNQQQKKRKQGGKSKIDFVEDDSGNKIVDYQNINKSELSVTSLDYLFENKTKMLDTLLEIVVDYSLLHNRIGGKSYFKKRLKYEEIEDGIGDINTNKHINHPSEVKEKTNDSLGLSSLPTETLTATTATTATTPNEIICGSQFNLGSSIINIPSVINTTSIESPFESPFESRMFTTEYKITEKINNTNNSISSNNVKTIISTHELKTCFPEKFDDWKKKNIDTSNIINILPELQEIGRWGEALVYQYLLLQSKHLSSDQVNINTTVEWMNEIKESRAAYDFIVTEHSFSKTERSSISKRIYVEVKTTRFDKNNMFEISLNEWEFATKLPYIQYSIYRVFNAGDINSCRIEIIHDVYRYIKERKVKLCLAI
jgi:hypothetical protein